MVITNYKYSIIGLCLVMLIASCLYFFNNNNSINTVTIHGSHAYYSSAKDMETKADLIIVGTPTKAFNDCTPTITYNNSGRYENFYTITDIRISKILKGEYKDDIVPVAQNAAIDKREKIMLIDDDYSPMEKDKKYLMFLKKNQSNGFYYILGVNQGKHNIDNFDNNEKELLENDTHYKKLRQEVLINFNCNLSD
ncbi:MAG: hypothetical protein A4E55_01202 [Pelotomaculum sp. PtaU1.Bin035]|nr:MAG: hypothetical protein A4E55_01202 [Pelotomaculum sp. PtaU1.Bin035]